ncbi:MAG: ATP-binding protein [Nevskiales bacterium]
MGKPGWRSLLGLLAWVGFVGTMVGLHWVQPPAEMSLGAAHWTLTTLDPPVRRRELAPDSFGVARDQMVGSKLPPTNAGAVDVGSKLPPTVSLPHQWDAHGARLHAARYETAFDLAAAPTEPQVIYIPSLRMNAAVFVNGTRIADGGSLTEPLARQSYRPLLFTVPDALLHSGANRIAVEVHSAPPGSGLLQQVYLGPQAQLKPYFDLRHFLKFQFYAGLIVVMAVLGTIMFGVWLARRDERVYLWYAMCTASFLVYALFIAATDLPLPSLWWDCLQRIAIMWMVACITLFISHFIGLSQPRLAVALGWVCLIGPVVLVALAALLPPDAFYLVLIRVWLNAVLGFGLYPTWLAARELWLRRDARTFWMFVSGASVIATGTHDVAFENGLIAPFNGFYFHYGMPLVLIVFTSILGLRFLNALRESEVLNRELNERVLQKQAELERTYEDLKRSEQARLLADERERIQRDMHDGLGGTLVSTLAGLELQGEQDSSAAQSLRSALDDLRLMIYSLDQTSGTLRAALAMLRERLARLAEEAGLALEWDMQNLPAELALERGATLQLMRIVQEAFTNTVKHARAKTFRLAVSPQAGGVSLEMRDDGAGFDAAKTKSGGYGLSNMRVRAQKIGGHLEIESRAGTRITLSVPLADAVRQTDAV